MSSFFAYFFREIGIFLLDPRFFIPSCFFVPFVVE